MHAPCHHAGQLIRLRTAFRLSVSVSIYNSTNLGNVTAEHDKAEKLNLHWKSWISRAKRREGGWSLFYPATSQLPKGSWERFSKITVPRRSIHEYD